MSTPSGAGQKTCVVCGEDVSSRPRTKDNKGRYFCTACYEKAIAHKHARREGGSAAPAAPAGAPPPLPASPRPAPKGWEVDDGSDAPLQLADDSAAGAPTPPAPGTPGAPRAAGSAEKSVQSPSRPPPASSSSASSAAPARTRQRLSASPPPLLNVPDDDPSGEPNILEHLLELEPLHAPKAMICPTCRSSIPHGSFICTTCGHNLQTGETVRPTKVKAQRAAGGTLWPALVGSISLTFGIGGVLFYGLLFLLAIVGALREGLFTRGGIVGLGFYSLLFWLAAWLLRDSIRILKRDSEGVKWLRFWALAKLLLYGTCFSLLMTVPARILDEGLQQLPALEGELTGSDIKTALLLLMVWFLFWPAFVMVFFFIPRIQDDVEAWD